MMEESVKLQRDGTRTAGIMMNAGNNSDIVFPDALVPFHL